MNDGTAIAEQEAALETTCGAIDLSARTKIGVYGADRASFLHNFCTNEVRNLAAGSGVEAFLLDAKGQVRFHTLIAARPEFHLLEASPGVGDALVRHLERYILREQVRLVDRSAAWGEVLIAGPQAADVVRRALNVEPPDAELASVAAPEFGDEAFVMRSVQASAPNFALFLPRDAADEAWRRLNAAGVATCDRSVYEAVRIVAGFPEAPNDFADKTLPQEVNRDRRALHFRKGCYLGQETVARLDALGHVHRLLVGLRSAAASPTTAAPDVPTSGTELQADGRKAGTIASAAYSPRRRAIVATAYVGVDCARPGTKLASQDALWEVVATPMPLDADDVTA